MPNHKSAEERMRRNERDQNKNRHYKKKMKDALKDVLNAGDKKSATEKLSQFSSLMDKMVSKGIINKNKSARYKSRMAAKVAAKA